MKCLIRRNTWSDKDKYNVAARRLAAFFVKNFEKFGNISKEIVKAGPKNLEKRW